MDQLRHLFIAPGARLRTNWLKAFPGASSYDQIPVNPDADIVWVLLPEKGDVVNLLAQCRSAAGKLPIIALSDIPNNQQELMALGSGAAGYCNGHAAPVVLRQVAETVMKGSLWVGQWLMKRLLAGIARAAAQKISPPALSVWASTLTDGEVKVARSAASGLGSREIANQLGIAEHAVGVHLNSVLDKLKLRDRMHLTLLVNGVVKS